MYWNDGTGLAGEEAAKRLIETWDVLKWMTFLLIWFIGLRLIETWDVLKFVYRMYLLYASIRLIETWDVLKLAFAA